MREFPDKDQRAVAYSLLGVVALYSFVALVLVAIVAIRINIVEPRLDAMRRGNPASAMLFWNRAP